MNSSIIFALLTWFIASIFYAYQYILRIMPNIMVDDIMSQYNMDEAIFGQYSGVYYIGYALMQVPVGILLDTQGAKKVMSVSILLTVLGLLPIIFTNILLYPIIGRVLIGIGSASAILGSLKLIRMLFKEEHIPKLYGFTMAIGIAGAIYGGEPIRMVSVNFGYKNLIIILAVIGVILAGLVAYIIPNRRTSQKAVTFHEVKEIFYNKNILALSIFSGLLVGPIECFSYIWGEEFLEHVYKLDVATANELSSLIFLGACVGSPLLAFIAAKNNKYLETIIASGAIMTVFFIFLLTQKLTEFFFIPGFFILGIFSSYEILSLYKVTMYVPENIASLATAIANMIIMLFGYGFHMITGYIVNAYLDTGIENAYILGVIVIPVTLILGTTGFIFLQKNDTTKPI